MSFPRARNYSLKSISHQQNDKRQSQQPLQRQKAPKILPTIAQNRETQKLQSKQLGINIKKFQNMILLKSNQVDNDQILRSAYYILKNFGEVDNNFKELFVDLRIKLKDYLFFSDSEIGNKYKIREGMSYRNACKLIDKSSLQMIKNKDQQIVEIKEKLIKTQQKNQIEIEGLKVQICELKQEVAKFKKMSNVQYVKSLEKRIVDLKQTISNQEDEYNVLAKKNQVISQQLDQVKRNLSELEINCSNFQAKLYDLQVLKERTQFYLLNTKDRFDELANRMNGLKEIIAKVEAENESLSAERIKLVNRAAVSFDDLTPRPKYSDYYLIDTGTYLNPTNQIMKNLIEQHNEDKNELFKKYFTAKKNRKLMQCEAIRQKTLQQIYKSQSQVTKLS